MWDLCGPGIEPMSPTLAGRFFTTEPPGKPIIVSTISSVFYRRKKRQCQDSKLGNYFIANICWIIKKAREFQKNIYFCFIDYTKRFVCVYHNKLWKILKEMGIPDHLTWEICMQVFHTYAQATVRTRQGITDWFQIGKGVCQGCMLSPCLLNLYAEYIMRNAGLEEAQAGIKIAGRNINNLRLKKKKPQIHRWHHPYDRKRRGTKEPLDESESGE